MSDSLSVGPEEEITMIRSARFFDELIEPIRQILEKHGASVAVFKKECIITFPAGTIRQRLYPVVLIDRYKVTFPDGYCLYQHTSIYIEEYSNVLFVLDEFPLWVQRIYGRVNQ
jgi:hypothetical protein